MHSDDVGLASIFSPPRSGLFLTMICTTAMCIGRLRAWAGALALGIAAGIASPPATADGLDTSAEYIAAFFRYVQWLDEDQLPAWTVCFAGEMPPDQQRTYLDRTVRGKPFLIRDINADAPLNDCQAIDLTVADIETSTRILARSRGLPILTVGSGAEFCSRGGQICLRKDGVDAKSSRNFAVNLSNIKESKLQVSARLLTIGLVSTANEDAR